MRRCIDHAAVEQAHLLASWTAYTLLSVFEHSRGAWSVISAVSGSK
jgi:hypothetical protein